MNPLNPSDMPRDVLTSMDFEPRAELERLQLVRLQQVVRHTYDNVAWMRERMEAARAKPQDIGQLADIAALPLTTKADLRDAYPYGMLATPLADVVRVHASSGTTGKPVIVPYTQHDLDVWIDVMVRTLAACNLTSQDIVQNSFGYGLFTGGLGIHYGAERLGATVIPLSGGNTDRQLMVMKDLQVTAICCTPSYFVHLLDRAQELGEDLSSLPLRVGVFGAEPWTEAMRRRIEEAAAIEAFDIYGLSEIIGPGVATECAQHAGLHIFEDHFFPEVIDSGTGDLLPDGEEGELVLTTLTKQALPLIRFRTGDITAIIPEPCRCGREIRRIRRISRRNDDMLIIRGVNVYPAQIESVLLAAEGTIPHYRIVLSREKGLDELKVEVETSFCADTERDRIDRLQSLIRDQLRRELGMRATVQVLPPRSIPRSEGKAARLLDQRND